MRQTRSFAPVRFIVAALAFTVPMAVAGAQAAAAETPITINSIGVGATSLSASGSSSVGWNVYYTGAMLNHFVWDTELAIFTENGAQSSAAQITGAYGWGPYLNRELGARERSAMFYAGGGVWYTEASTDPMGIVGAIFPLGPVMGRLGYGLVLGKNSNAMLLNVGFGFKFGQKP